MKIYTKTGDKGETSLFGGKRVSKDDLRIEAYGTVDELNSIVGVCRSFNENMQIEKVLAGIQDQLFVLGADLATPEDVRSTATKRIAREDYTVLEKTIDEIDTQLVPLESFVLPGGSKSAAVLHQARTICRRAERRVVALRKLAETSEHTVIYLNRLSDLLFVLARFANKISGTKEVAWNSRAESDRPA